MKSFSMIVLVSLFVVLFDNFSFFKNVREVYEISWHNIGFLLSLGCVLLIILILFLRLISSRYTLKPILIALLLISSLTSYFMNTYHVIIDDTMIQNMAETNVSESLDLLSIKLLVYLFLLGILPAFFVYKVEIVYGTWREEFWTTLKSLVLGIALVAIILFSFSKFYTSFFRENKSLRYHTNPLYALYSTGHYAYSMFDQRSITLKAIGLDAKKMLDTQPKLTIVVVGEAARANRFSLNGYERETNPLLKKEDIVNFSNLYSCGTSTAISVPCMFSILERGNYSDKVAKSTENVLDVLKHSGVNVLWRDNNSDSKGVAVRVTYEDYRTPQNNTICDEECRDEGMLVGLQEYIASQKSDILIVLHQMGNHGPAYYKRYPKAFEKFTPTCQTNQVEQCTTEEIGNAYDNTILYTDYFLTKTIDLLKKNDEKYQTALIYMADHGESLGENGIYLHGIPYFIAPETQTHVGALMWFGQKSKERIDVVAVREKASQNYSHDNLFHTILGIMGVETSVYEKTKDILLYQKP
ncbi:MAG: phosphoethanolamine--lipid A transferase [Campylobacteraceae bacterium]|nr:phosphoethanolamine--lipid A transferase [Campylobacteraceae bacterium]